MLGEHGVVVGLELLELMSRDQRLTCEDSGSEVAVRPRQIPFSDIEREQRKAERPATMRMVGLEHRDLRCELDEWWTDACDGTPSVVDDDHAPA